MKNSERNSILKNKSAAALFIFFKPTQGGRMEVYMVKIVHCADMHFDTPFSDLPSHIADIRRGELLTTFEKIIDKTAEFNADVLLIAGDVFENEYVSYKTVEFLKRCFAKISHIPVFIAPGNHDAIDENEIYNKIDLGENVTIFGEGIGCVTFSDKRFRVYGHGFKNRYEDGSIWKGLTCPDDEYVNIFVTHCNLPPYREERFAPISSEIIEKSGIHYLAAGHIHNHEGINRSGKTTYAYSGIPEGRKFDEAGEKGIIMGEVSLNGADLSFVSVCSRQLFTLKTDISGCLTYDDILSKTHTEISNIYRIILTGEKKEGIVFDSYALEKLFSEKTFYTKIIDDTAVSGHSEAGLIEKAFIDKMAKKDCSAEIRELATKYAVSALRRGQVGKR